MGPNQPKTPVSNFRLDEETKARLRDASAAMGVSMTEAIKRAAEQMAISTASLQRLRDAIEPDSVPPLVQFVQDRILEAERAMAPEGGLPSRHPYHPFLKAMWAVVDQVEDVEWGGYAVRDVVLEHFAAIWKDHPDYRAEWTA